MELNPTQFKQLSLLGEKSPLNRSPEPHEMSPQAFDNHPDTMFHATFQSTLPRPDVMHIGPMEVIDNPHEPGRDIRGKLGRYDSSMDSSYHEWGKEIVRDSRPVHLFSTQLAGKANNARQTAVSDDEGQQHFLEGSPARTLFYKNEFEGPRGAISISAPGSMVKTQADFVAKADPKAVHPVTKRAFDRGQLGNSVLPATYSSTSGDYSSNEKEGTSIAQQALLSSGGAGTGQLNVSLNALPDARFKKGK